MAEDAASGGPAGDRAPHQKIPEEGGALPRAKWANKTEFMFSMAGQIISLQNVWIFPYVCFVNGGGAFLIPYGFLLLFCGLPLFFLETALGQYTSEGGVTAWRKICPMLQGIGVASQVILTYMTISHILVLTWAIFYLCNSFKSPLPWSTCGNLWNTVSCQSTYSNFAGNLTHPDSDWAFTDTAASFSRNLTYLAQTAESEFWSNRVLRMSDSSLVKLPWDLALGLLLAWVMCYFCIWKGIKYTGKVVYFTVTFSYLLLVVIFIRAVTLPGAWEGVRFYLTPDFSRLANLHVWAEAGTQVFYSFALCQGVLGSLGSYNKYNNNCYRDCLLLCGLSTATSIFAGLAVFSVLGFMAHSLDIAIFDVATAGSSLVFVALPKALSMLPGSSFWAVVFFLMILFLGLDTQFLCLESLVTTLTDLFPRHLRRPWAREILVLAIAVVFFLLGLPLLTKGGRNLFNLIDIYGVSVISLLFIACFETITIGWVYGADRFYDNIEDMIGYPPFPVLKYCWMFITPLICGILLLYNLENKYYNLMFSELGPWTSIVGILLIIASLLCIPIFIFVSLFKNVQEMATPSGDLRQARPSKPILTLCKMVIYKAQAQPNRREPDSKKMMMQEARKV